MRASWNRAATVALAACGACLILPGCKNDVEKADALIRADLATATQEMHTGHADQARAALEKSAAATGGSPEVKIEANLLLSQTERNDADALLDQIYSQEAQLSVSLIGLERLGWQLAANNVNINASESMNPTAEQQLMQQTADAAEKGEQGVWRKGTAPVPSLDAVRQTEQDLQKKIDDLTKQRTELAAKQALAREQAAKFDQQADASKGEAAVGFYTQGANQRKEAADDDTKLQDLDAQLKPLQQQLAVAQAQRKSLEAAVASARKELDQIQAGWQKVQQQIEASKDFSKYLLDGSGAAPAMTASAADSSPGSPTTQPSASLSSLATEMDQQVKSLHDLRAQAADRLDQAWKHVDAAMSAAQALSQNITNLSRGDTSKLPEKHAWQQLQAVNDANGFKLAQAAIQSRLARLYTDQFTELVRRNAIARVIGPALKASGMEIPQSLGSLGDGGAPPPEVREPLAKIESDIVKSDFTGFADEQAALEQMAAAQASPSAQEAIASVRVDLHYLWADYLLSSVVQDAKSDDLSQLRVNIAHAAKMVNDYAWSQLAALEGKTAERTGRLANAVTEYKTLVDAKADNLLPTVLPPGLLEAATPATRPSATGGEAESAPATQPAAAPESTTPATQPATAAPTH